jgi:lanosterol synthase
MVSHLTLIRTSSHTPTAVDLGRMKDCVDVILSLQNPGGGFASYELIRGNKRMEWLNTAEVFGDIMIEYTYPESVFVPSRFEQGYIDNAVYDRCTTSSLSALLQFRKICPDYRRRDIE